MKQITTLFAGLLMLFITFNTQAQTAEEIIDNYFETIGGKENIANINTMKATCMAKAQGMDLPVVMYQAAPNKQRLDINFQGKEITQMAFDGETGWGTNFMTMEAEAWDAEQSAVTKTQMDFPDVFLDYKEKGYELSVEGEEEIQGVPCHIVKLTREPVMIQGKEEENVSYYYFDKETNVPIMQKSFALMGPQKGTAVEVYLSDYDEVDGMYFAFTIDQKMNGMDVFNISIEKIELNVPIEDSFFALPEKTTTDGK